MRVFADSGERDARAAAARAMRLRGDCLREIREEAKACEAYTEAIHVLTDLVSGGDTEQRGELAQALEGRSKALNHMGDVDAALADIDRSLAAYQAAPANSVDATVVAHAWMHRCSLLENADRPIEAQSACGSAIKLLRSSEHLREQESVSALLPILLMTDSRLRERYGDPDGSLTSAGEAVMLLERLQQRGPSAETDLDLARAFSYRAAAYEASGRIVSAVEDYTISIDKLELLAKEQTAVQVEQEELARIANTLGWLLASHSNASIRDPQKALRFARRACELTGYERWDYIDTLAAALARYGRFSKAVHWEKRAISLAPPEEHAELRNRLDSYESSQPFTIEYDAR